MEKRSKIYMGRAFQNLMLFYLSGVFLFGLMVFGGVFFILNSALSITFVKSFLFSLGISLVVALPLFAKIIISLTHRVSGPLYRLERNIEKMIEGELELDFKIREKDLVKSLAEKLELLNETYKDRFKVLRQSLYELKAELEELESRTEKLPLKEEFYPQLKRITEKTGQLIEAFEVEFFKEEKS